MLVMAGGSAWDRWRLTAVHLGRQSSPVALAWYGGPVGGICGRRRWPEGDHQWQTTTNNGGGLVKHADNEHKPVEDPYSSYVSMWI